MESLSTCAEITHLAGLDAITLTKLILDAQFTKDAEHSETCKDLFRHIKYIGNLLVELRVCELHNVSEIRESLIELEETLRSTYLLVAETQEQNYAYKFALGWKTDIKFKKARKELDRIISIISLNFLVDHNVGPPEITNPTDTSDRGDKFDDGEVNGSVSEDESKSAVDDREVNGHVSEEDDWELC